MVFKKGTGKGLIMKTWEMIKELTEEPNRKFERADGLTVRVNESGELVWKAGYKFLGLNDDWKKALSFMELLEKVKNNKNFSGIDYRYREIDDSFEKCNLWFILKSIAETSENDYELVDSILNGKWYVE